MEIRSAKESELEQVVALNCIAFNPNQHERYWQYVRGDSSYRLSQTRVVVVNDKVVSTLRVWERRIRIGASLVMMGGIGGVCTDPKYRGVGYASALMRDTIGYLKTRGYDLGVLFTIIPAEFYHRLGWTSLPLHGFSAECGAETGTAIPSEWQVKDFNVETDLDAVASIHDIANAQQSGTVSRTRAYWDMKPSRIRGILPSVVAVKNGDTGGYLNFQIEDKCAEALEVGYLPNSPEVLDTLVSYFMRTCTENRVEEIRGMFSSEHPYVEQLITKGNGEVRVRTDTAMMLYAVNLPVMLRRFVVAWETLIADTDENFPSLAVRFPVVNNQQVVLRYDGNGTIQIVDDASDAVDIVMHEDVFWQLLFGELGWEQVKLQEKTNTSVSAEVSAFLDVLFPKRDVIFWYPDRY